MKVIFAFIFCISSSVLAQNIQQSQVPRLSEVERQLGPINVIESESEVTVTINGSKVKDMEEILHNLALALKFPSYYGNNLDALFEIMSDANLVQKKTAVIIMNGGWLASVLGEEQHQALLDVLNDSQEANSNLTFWYWQ